MELPGVAEASDRAREALGRAHRHRANLRGWPVTAAEAALRAARASSVLDGGPIRLEDLADAGKVSDPVFAGALRVAQALEGGEGPVVGIWRRAPCRRLPAYTCWPRPTRSTPSIWVARAAIPA